MSELDRFGGRGADHLVMCGAILNALGFQVAGDRVQDLQELGAIGGTVQEGGCQVAGHGRIQGWVDQERGRPLRRVLPQTLQRERPWCRG